MRRAWPSFGCSFVHSCFLSSERLSQFQQSQFCKSFPRIWQMSVGIDIPAIVNTLFLHHIEIGMCGPGFISVIQWNWECFFLRHVELNSRFIDGDKWSHLVSTRRLFWLQRHLLILSVEALPIRLEVLPWDLHSLRFDRASEWVLGIRSHFLTILLYHLLLVTWNLLLLWYQCFFRIDSSTINFWCVHLF